MTPHTILRKQKMKKIAKKKEMFPYAFKAIEDSQIFARNLKKIQDVVL